MMEELENLNVPGYYAFISVYFFGEGGIGRRRLSEKLGLSESRTRTMVEHMEKAGYLETGNLTKLTRKGKKLYDEALTQIKEIENIHLEELSVADENIAALIRSEEQIGSEIKIRDQAVRAGAEGLTVLVYRGGFTFPDSSVSPQQSVGAEDLEKLNQKFEAEEGDILFVASAEKLEDAKSGLWSSVSFFLD